MSNLKPVSRVTLSEQVASQLAEEITLGRWSPGERLPTEAELCSTLGIGRSTLREALKSLAFVGLVQGRPGEGTYVVDGVHRSLERILSPGLLRTEKEIEYVGEARLILETEIAALAAQRAEPSDIERLAKLLAEMEKTLSGKGRKSYVALDVEFHLGIATCTKNWALREFLARMREMLQEWIARSQELPGIRESAHVQHTRILEAVRQHNPERARRMMREHLQTCEKAFTLLGKISQTAADRRSTAREASKAVPAPKVVTSGTRNTRR